MKTRVPLILFCILTLITGCASKEERTKGSIERVLALDQCYGKEKAAKNVETLSRLDYALSVGYDNLMIAAFKEFAQNIFTYTKKAQGIDLSSVPKEFAVAYYQHLSAWEDKGRFYLEFNIKIPPKSHSLGDDLFAGLGRLFGEYTTQEDVNKLMRQEAVCDTEIKRTWREVEILAIRYGARIKVEK